MKNFTKTCGTPIQARPGKLEACKKGEVTPIDGMFCMIQTPMLKPQEKREPTLHPFLCDGNREKLKKCGMCLNHTQSSLHLAGFDSIDDGDGGRGGDGG